jgi:hypothetical protein
MRVCLLAFSCCLSVLCCYLMFISCSVLNIGRCRSCVSCSCTICVRDIFSSVLMFFFSFLCVFLISMVSVMGPYLCPVFGMWFEYPELLLLFLLLICVLCILCEMFCLFGQCIFVGSPGILVANWRCCHICLIVCVVLLVFVSCSMFCKLF